tara:strand:+ start:1564 stop:2163 length:600 start_codon:yes stop_codon:yes gene_type:complete
MIINQQHKYSIFKHEPLINNQNYFISDIKIGRQFLKDELKTDELTWIYQKYNIFGILAGSHYYWNLFKDIGVCIKKHILDNLKQETLPKNMWIQAWLNWHTKDQLLKKHHHADDGKGFMHGFISIEPQNTKTIFYERYEDKEPIYHINNEVGNIYIGDGNKWHEVVSDKGFSGDRITIGFDVMTRNSATKNFGFIPIIY